MKSVYNIVEYDGGYRLLRRYSPDSYIINGEDVTRVHFTRREDAENLLETLIEFGYADGYEEKLPEISWQKRAVVEYGDWEPLARRDYTIIPDNENEDLWLDKIHLSTALERVNNDTDYDWLNWVEEAEAEWSILKAAHCLEDYPDDYRRPW